MENKMKMRDQLESQRTCNGECHECSKCNRDICDDLLQLLREMKQMATPQGIDLQAGLEAFITANIDLFVDYSENRYWFTVTKAGEFGKSAPITTSTQPNPVNWWPHEEEVIWNDWFPGEGMEIDNDVSYYLEDPSQFLADFHPYVCDLLDQAVSAWQEMWN